MDPVRYLTNPSSGAMGIELAKALHEKGARVVLVLGPTDLSLPRKIKTRRVVSAVQMQTVVKKNFQRCDAFIATAAVCDFRFEKVYHQKWKKGKTTFLRVRLKKNPDILAEAGKSKGSSARPVLVGFSLETEKLERFASKKLNEKNLDLIIGNKPGSFGSRTIRPLWIEKGGLKRPLPPMTKRVLSKRIARWLEQRFHE